MTVRELMDILWDLNSPDSPICYINGDEITGVKIITDLGKDGKKQTKFFINGINLES